MSQSDSAEQTTPIHAEFHEAVKQLEAMPNMGPVKKVLGILHRMVGGKPVQEEKTVDVQSMVDKAVAKALDEQQKSIDALVAERISNEMAEFAKNFSAEYDKKVKDAADALLEAIQVQLDKKQDKPEGA